MYSGEQILHPLCRKVAMRGLSAEEEKLSKKKKKKKDVCVLAVFDTLEYLKQGGRISKTAAWAGNILSIQLSSPLKKAEVAILEKKRGSENGNNILIQEVKNKNGIDFSMPYMLGYSGLDDSLLRKYIADSADLWAGQTKVLPISTIGSTIGTHAGPGPIYVSFFINNNDVGTNIDFKFLD